jgi:hypothetical protein
MRLLAVLLLCCSCGPLDSWNPPLVGYVDTSSGCPRYAHNVRGPDAYDSAHGRPYHCEVPFDESYGDIDMVDQ